MDVTVICYPQNREQKARMEPEKGPAAASSQPAATSRGECVQHGKAALRSSGSTAGPPKTLQGGECRGVTPQAVCPGSLSCSPITLEHDLGKLIVPGAALRAQKVPLATRDSSVRQLTAARWRWRERHGHLPRRLQGLLPETSLGTEQ